MEAVEYIRTKLDCESAASYNLNRLLEELGGPHIEKSSFVPRGCYGLDQAVQRQNVKSQGISSLP